MNREESKAKLAKLEQEVHEFVKKYNEAYQGGKFEDAVKANTEIENRVNEYTSIAREMCFTDCKESADPMMTAIKLLTYQTIAVKDVKKGDDKVPVREVVPKIRNIDLVKLHKFCGTIGADPQWIHIAQKLNFLMTAKVCTEIGADVKAVNDSYSMTEIAKQIDMGKNPTSNTNLLKSMQTVITAMLGDGYKATSHDVRFMDRAYTKKGRRALTLVCSNHKNFCGIMAEVCHRIVTGKSYDAEYKTIKDKPAGNTVVITKDEPKPEVTAPVVEDTATETPAA